MHAYLTLYIITADRLQAFREVHGIENESYLGIHLSIVAFNVVEMASIHVRYWRTNV
jgi:hypothetical protein